MPLSPEQQALCERVEKGEPEPGAAALIRQQAQEIDALWDRLSHAYALVRRETPAEMIQKEIEVGCCNQLRGSTFVVDLPPYRQTRASQT